MATGSRCAEGNVLGDAGIEQEGVLAYHPEPLLPTHQIKAGPVGAIHKNFSFGWGVQTCQKVGEGALTSTAAPDQGDGLTLGKNEVDIREGWL